MHRLLPPGKSLSTSSLLPATSPMPPARPRPHTKDGMPVPAVSLLCSLLPCLDAALGSTVPITAAVCRRQPGTCRPTARGCPPCLPSSCHHPKRPVFLSQAAKTASAALRKGEPRPRSGPSHWEVPEGWKSPFCPKPQPPACNTGDSHQPGSVHGPEGPLHPTERLASPWDIPKGR